MSISAERGPGERLQEALDLLDFALRMFRERLRREHPGWTEVEVDAKVEEWLAHRPGAEFGDAEGEVVPWPRP